MMCISGGGGSGLDFVILLSLGGGWVLITVDYGGGLKCQKNERPLVFVVVSIVVLSQAILCPVIREWWAGAD